MTTTTTTTEGTLEMERQESSSTSMTLEEDDAANLAHHISKDEAAVYACNSENEGLVAEHTLENNNSNKNNKSSSSADASLDSIGKVVVGEADAKDGGCSFATTMMMSPIAQSGEVRRFDTTTNSDTTTTASNNELLLRFSMDTLDEIETDETNVPFDESRRDEKDELDAKLASSATTKSDDDDEDSSPQDESVAARNIPCSELANDDEDDDESQKLQSLVYQCAAQTASPSSSQTTTSLADLTRSFHHQQSSSGHFTTSFCTTIVEEAEESEVLSEEESDAPVPPPPTIPNDASTTTLSREALLESESSNIASNNSISSPKSLRVDGSDSTTNPAAATTPNERDNSATIQSALVEPLLTQQQQQRNNAVEAHYLLTDQPLDDDKQGESVTAQLKEPSTLFVEVIPGAERQQQCKGDQSSHSHSTLRSNKTAASSTLLVFEHETNSAVDESAGQDVLPSTLSTSSYNNNSGSVFSPSVSNDHVQNQDTSASSVHRDGDDDEGAGEESSLSVARAVDFQETTELLGASRMAFMEQLRGAAFRRKMNLARSRDSLIAKELQQREIVAASIAARAQREEEEERQAALAAARQRRNSLPASYSSSNQQAVAFKARPLPETTGLSGSGGLSGVPKVEKKPTTTPFSPLLGARRHMSSLEDSNDDDDIHALQKSVAARQLQVDDDDDGHTFKARPLPKATGQLGSAGQAGVPKVQKRQVTVPQSPLLGARRLPPSSTQHSRTNHTSSVIVVEAGQAGIPKVQKRPVTVPQSPLLGARRPRDTLEGNKKKSSRPPLDGVFRPVLGRSSLSLDSQSKNSSSTSQSLVGLDLCCQKENNEDDGEAQLSTPRNAVAAAYIPHSTVRAQKRAEFDSQREQNELLRKEEERRERKERVRALRKELGELRMSI